VELVLGRCRLSVGGFVASQGFRGIAALPPHEVGNLIDIVDVFFKHLFI